jgi:hypothetical protein
LGFFCDKRHKKGEGFVNSWSLTKSCNNLL